MILIRDDTIGTLNGSLCNWRLSYSPSPFVASILKGEYRNPDS